MQRRRMNSWISNTDRMVLHCFKPNQHQSPHPVLVTRCYSLLLEVARSYTLILGHGTFLKRMAMGSSDDVSAVANVPALGITATTGTLNKLFIDVWENTGSGRYRNIHNLTDIGMVRTS